MLWINAGVLVALVVALAIPLAQYMEAVFTGERTQLSPVLRPLECAIYRWCGVRPDAEMGWEAYALCALATTAVGTAILYAILRTQAWLPLNPQHFPNFDPVVAWNTTLSFVTTTDWQVYSGENAASYFSQMAGLAWQNFVASAIGLAAGVAVIRGFARQHAQTLGNFWVDLIRSLLYVLLPLSVLFGLVFAFTGMPQNFGPSIAALNPEHFAQQITGGPMASQEAISLLGGNGGGFVGANTSAPNLNPNGFSNVLELLAIWLIPAAFPLLFGRMVRNRAAGYALLAAMFVVAAIGFAVAQGVETAGNPLIHALGVNGGNMEGKEVRFGAANAGLSLAVSSNSGTGASNFAYDSLMPLGGLVALVNMQLGEVIFGGVGSGLYGMLMFAVLTVFIAGLLVGRTPEYLGKKIERHEVQYAMIAALVFPAMVLIATAIAAVAPAGRATLGNVGAHGFSEILYAFTSVASNNGSAFGGLGSNLFYDIATGIVALAGRYLVMIPMLALAGSLAWRPTNTLGAGTFRTDNAMFVVLLIGVIVLFGALTFLPADALGPIAEHVQLWQRPAGP
jgi:K+-transporting ATPase ATPase A chain